MADDDRGKRIRLPKIKFDSRILKKRVKKAKNVTVRHAHKFIISRWSSVIESQRHIVVWILIIGLIITATGFQLVWFQKNYRTKTNTSNGTYAEAVLGPIDTFNPLFAESSAEQSIKSLLFSSILKYDQSGKLNYDIASNIKINDDNTIYTVSIRSDVKWNDDTKLTTADIAFTIDLIKNSIVRSTIKGWDDIKVRVIDDYTIEFTTDFVFAPFEHLLTFPILPKHILGNVSPDKIRENNFSQKPIGSGPFKLNFIQDVDESLVNKVVYLVKNNNYYGGKVNLEKFQLHIYSTTDELIHAIKTNEVNAVADLSPIEVKQINTKKYKVISKPIQSGVYAILNTKSGFLNDVNIRRALQQSTDTAKLRSEISSSLPSMDLPITNSQLMGVLPTVQPFDLISANKILDDSGWLINNEGIREKDGVEFKLEVVVLKDNELEQVMSILIEQWKKLGINIETKIVDPTDISQNVVQSILQPRDFDVLIHRINIGADPDVYAYWHSSQTSPSGLNYSNYSNLASDDALLSARTRVEPELRNVKYLTFSKLWLDDVPAIGLYQSIVSYVSSKEVNTFKNTNIFNSSTDRYSDIIDWSVGSKDVYKTP